MSNSMGPEPMDLPDICQGNHNYYVAQNPLIDKFAKIPNLRGQKKHLTHEICRKKFGHLKGA